jgi:hypothetical protein
MIQVYSNLIAPHLSYTKLEKKMKAAAAKCKTKCRVFTSFIDIDIDDKLLEFVQSNVRMILQDIRFNVKVEYDGGKPSLFIHWRIE